VATTCPACGHQFGGKKLEQRIDRKAALAAYDKLRLVQQDILFNLYRFTFLSLRQIADTYFDAAEKDKRSELAGKHLAVLKAKGLVVEEQRRDQHSKKFYYPSREGMFVCQVEERQDARKIKRVKESQAHSILSSIHSRHRQGINDVMTSFVKAERHDLGELTGYWGDRDITYIFSSGGSRRRLQPDSTFLWSANGRGHLAWLELENSRASVADLEEKIKKYLGFESAGYNRGDTFKKALAVDQFPPLLVVAAKPSQLPGLRRAILHGVLEAHVGTIQDVATRVVIGLTSLDLIREYGALGDVWEPVLQAKGLCNFTGLFDL
jgi:hypothetical protein